MRRVRYSVAMSLDGFIADPDGGYDWIIMEPAIDFEAFLAQMDTVLVGRKSYQMAVESDMGAPAPGLRTIVFSTTLDPAEHPGVTIVPDRLEATIAELKAEPGKDLWLWGGGELFRSFLERNLVDTVEVGIIPVLLGRGLPLLPETDHRVRLDLTGVETFPSGVMLAKYDVKRPTEPA